ncbi:VCBS repeat-containing protein [Streptomyces sp. NBC_01214]|uniref:FG-GAP repeat domain-containing protein n=1 Tax=Streptomyces sp. NBC_01214 TaxID=2903777 RepID=UPI002252FCC2|nr:VCBS repeat-containing protein [Streptomyces sp. NBC_01214]MCX4804551.1 VCBS repeat-containing protein [Streptomyces sp. NBC_01214]
MRTSNHSCPAGEPRSANRPPDTGSPARSYLGLCTLDASGGWDFTQTAAANFDGNGKADLTARDATGYLKIWAGHGDGTFGCGAQLSGGWDFTQAVAADFDGDGRTDIIARDDTTFASPTTLTAGW